VSFGEDGVKALFDALKSHAMSLGVFDQRVATHAPLSTPGNGLSCWFTGGPLVPVPSSGLAAVSVELTVMAHITASLNQRPLDAVEAQVIGAASLLLAAYAGDFTLGGLVREVNIFGGLRAQPSYVLFEDKPFRLCEVSVPMVINDAWVEAS
jgi:hypothetical protein